MPIYNLSMKKEATTLLPQIGFKQKSVQFGINSIEKYSSTYEQPLKSEWRHLDLGKNYSDKTSSTIYCGGTVSAIDWAPSTGESEFLAVACNSETKEGQMNLKQTTKSCIQIYEFKDLSNKE
jgi:hypothetical protein